jgi:hypothetical protein
MAPTPNVAESLLRYGGMYGSAWRKEPNGTFVMLAEVVTVVADAQINRITVPIVGATREGHKPGRETREGTMTIQKVDAKWELEIWNLMSAGLEQRRKLRDDPTASAGKRTFDLHLKQDDPDALGLEEWVLYDCQLWALPLGIAIADDTIEREYPLTWEREEPLNAFVAQRVGDTIVPNWLKGGYASDGTAPATDF